MPAVEFVSWEVTVLLSVFSLAWFLVGLLSGLAWKCVRTNGKPSSESRQSAGDAEIYVGNLSYETTERDLSKAFEQYGKVKSVRLIKNKINGKSKGYGFVEMVDRDTSAAIRALNGKEFQGRKIVVNEAKSRGRS